MDIIHTDHNGEQWAFSIDCTPYQAAMLRNTLRGVSNIGGRERLTMRYYLDEENEAFCREIERAILTGLASLSPMIRGQHQGPTPQPVTTDEEQETGYYWEKF